MWLLLTKAFDIRDVFLSTVLDISIFDKASHIYKGDFDISSVNS